MEFGEVESVSLKKSILLKRHYNKACLRSFMNVRGNKDIKGLKRMFQPVIEKNVTYTFNPWRLNNEIIQHLLSL